VFFFLVGGGWKGNSDNHQRPLTNQPPFLPQPQPQVDAGVPILNVSTFLTNLTLVEDHHLHATLDTLSEELDAAIDGLHTLGPLDEEGEGEGEEELVARMAGLGSGGGGVLRA
jgi:hypothetical protein